MNAIKSELKRAIFSKTFILTAIGFAFLITFEDFMTIIEVYKDYLSKPCTFHYSFVRDALSDSAVKFVLPVIAVLPYSNTFVTEMQNGFIKNILPKAKRNNYIFSKIFASVVSGFAVCAVGILFALLISYGIFAAKEIPYSKADFGTGEVISFIQVMLRCSFVAMLSASFGSMASLLFNNRYMAYASPFVAYYMLIILNERYIDSVYLLYPYEWLDKTHSWPFDEVGLIVFLILLTVLFSVIFFLIGKWRLKDV